MYHGLFYKVKAFVWFFRKRAKEGKIFQNLGKNVQNLKIFWKGAGDGVRTKTARINAGLRQK